MPSVIQELAGDDVTLDYAHVYERVVEWQQRLSALYNQIVSWLPEFSEDRSDTVEMNEELMREYGVAPVRLPVLRLSSEGREVAELVPRGLWIIGANGRIDLSGRKGRFLIIDRSEYFSPPQWTIAPSLDRLDIQPLSRDTLLQTMQ